VRKTPSIASRNSLHPTRFRVRPTFAAILAGLLDKAGRGRCSSRSR
jgi:hypothetical protein